MAKKKQNSHLNWHPDFRVESELPDIKIVRTDFIVNGIAGFVALVALVLVVTREVDLRSMHGNLSDLKAEVASLEQGNAENLKDSKLFKDTAPLITDIEKFKLYSVEPIQTVMAISEILPDGVLLESLRFNEVSRQVKKRSFPAYRLKLSGVAPSLEAITVLKESLEVLELFSGYPSNVVERPSPRDEATGFFNFQIDVSINPEFK
ncbi:MAG: hypothetical protein ACPGN3_06460 [Opitutales bacterium]